MIKFRVTRVLILLGISMDIGKPIHIYMPDIAISTRDGNKKIRQFITFGTFFLLPNVFLWSNVRTSLRTELRLVWCCEVMFKFITTFSVTFIISVDVCCSLKSNSTLKKKLKFFRCVNMHMSKLFRYVNMNIRKWYLRYKLKSKPSVTRTDFRIFLEVFVYSITILLKSRDLKVFTGTSEL